MSLDREYGAAAHSIYNLRYKTPKEVHVVFHNVSNYEYYFIIKELAENFEGQVECMGEKQGEVHNVIRTNQKKKKNENGKQRTCKIKFIDNVRFISSSLSSLAESFSEGLHTKTNEKIGNLV